jgi:hypothetical protein
MNNPSVHGTRGRAVGWTESLAGRKLKKPATYTDEATIRGVESEKPLRRALYSKRLERMPDRFFTPNFPKPLNKAEVGRDQLEWGFDAPAVQYELAHEDVCALKNNR